MIANGITISRIIFSIALFFIVKESNLFFVLYILCGISDVLDGLIARALHTESEIGATLDSVGDLIFAIMYIIKILPSFSLLFYEYIWIILIAIVKIIIILFMSIRMQKFYIEHSIFNKFTGVLIFILPLSAKLINLRYSIIFVCIVATITVIDEIKNYICKIRIIKN